MYGFRQTIAGADKEVILSITIGRRISMMGSIDWSGKTCAIQVL
jgi:hypothetical protein